MLWLSYKSLTSWSAWYSSRYTAKPRLLSLAMDKGTSYKLRENVHLGIPFTGGIHICQPNWGYRWCVAPCPYLLSRRHKDFQACQSLEMFPALAGKPSAFMSGLLEFRSPLLITQLGASFEMLCVILSNSQNGEFKAEQMLRRGMLVVLYSMRLKVFGWYSITKWRLRGDVIISEYFRKGVSATQEQNPPGYSSMWTRTNGC